MSDLREAAILHLLEAPRDKSGALLDPELVQEQVAVILGFDDGEEKAGAVTIVKEAHAEGVPFKGPSGRWFVVEQGRVRPAKAPNAAQEGGKPKTPAASTDTTHGQGEIDPDANRPSRPENRHSGSVPKALPWRDPPPKKGKTGEGMKERPRGDSSQTKLGDEAEELARRLGFRNILPEGQRCHKPGEVKTKGSTIDVEFDHSGRAYEVKMCQTTATEYRLKAKKEEKTAKERFARKHKLKPYTMIAVRDGDAGEIHFYAAKSPGLIGAEVSEKAFDFVGTVKI